MRAADWTRGEDGRTNSSPLFHALTKEVARLIREDANVLIAGRAEDAAGLILAQLAHVHGLSPRRKARR